MSRTNEDKTIGDFRELGKISEKEISFFLNIKFNLSYKISVASCSFRLSFSGIQLRKA